MFFSVSLRVCVGVKKPAKSGSTVWGSAIALKSCWVVTTRGGWGSGGGSCPSVLPYVDPQTEGCPMGPFAPMSMFRGCQMLFCAVRFTPRTEHCRHKFCPSRNRPCIFSCCSTPSQGFFLGQDKIRSGFTQDTVGFFALSEGDVFFGLFLGAACLSNLCGGLPRLATICFAFLRSALCARLLLRSCSAIVRLFLANGVSGFGRPKARCFPLSFSLSSLVVRFLVFSAATLSLMPRQLLR